jgi:hypothetical protein
LFWRIEKAAIKIKRDFKRTGGIVIAGRFTRKFHGLKCEFLNQGNCYLREKMLKNEGVFDGELV